MCMLTSTPTIPCGTRYSKPGHQARTVLHRRWSMFLEVRRCRGEFLSVELGVSPCDDRPRLGICGRFAGKVARVELGDGGLEVVGVERDARPRSGRRRRSRLRHKSSTWNDSGSSSRRDNRERIRTRRSPRVAMTSDVAFVTPRSAAARKSLISASRSCRSRHSPPDDDPRLKCRRPGSRRTCPSLGPQSTPGSAQSLGLPRFPVGARGCTSSNRACAASSSAIAASTSSMSKNTSSATRPPSSRPIS